MLGFFLFLFSMTLIPDVNQESTLTGSKLASNDMIEIIQLSVSEDNNSVDIIFRLDGDVDSGIVLFHRREPGADPGSYIWPEFQDVDIGDLEVYDASVNWFILTDNNPFQFPYLYYLALDKDGEGADQYTYIHGTIFLQDISYDLCTRELTLIWDHYIVDPKPGSSDQPEAFFTHYQIIHNGQELDVVEYDENVEQQEYKIKLDDPGNNEFRIRAIDSHDPDLAQRNSFSNAVEQTVYWPELDEVVIENVSVTPGGDVEVSIGVVGVDFPEYLFFIERSRQKEGDYQEIAEITIDSTLYTFTDEQADGLDQDIWYYRVRAHLSDAGGHPCDEPAVVSGPVSTLWLSASSSEDDPSEIYFEFRRDPAANSYTLMQRLPGDTDFEDAAVTGPISPYRHDINDELVLFGVRLRGVHMGMEYYSNTVELYIEPEIKIPNAFRPGSELSENRVFKPFFPDGFEYSIRIYNRNGLQVYSSGSSDAEQWDGNINGVPAPEGTYLYHIIYTAPFHDIPDGEKKGTVYLVR